MNLVTIKGETDADSAVIDRGVSKSLKRADQNYKRKKAKSGSIDEREGLRDAVYLAAVKAEIEGLDGRVTKNELKKLLKIKVDAGKITQNEKKLVLDRYKKLLNVVAHEEDLDAEEELINGWFREIKDIYERMGLFNL